MAGNRCFFNTQKVSYSLIFFLQCRKGVYAEEMSDLFKDWPTYYLSKYDFGFAILLIVNNILICASNNKVLKIPLK